MNPYRSTTETASPGERVLGWVSWIAVSAYAGLWGAFTVCALFIGWIAGRAMWLWTLLILGAVGSAYSADPRELGPFRLDIRDRPQTVLAPIRAYETSFSALPRQAIGKLTVRYGGGSQGGTATLLPGGYVISAWHVVQGVSGTTTFELGGQAYGVSERWYNRYADQCLMKLSTVPEAKPAQLAPQPPRQGAWGYVFGFGPGGSSPKELRGRLSSYGTKQGNRQGSTASFVGMKARSGDSGAGVFNDAGEYIGTLWGSGPNDFAAIRYSETVDFIRRVGVLDAVHNCQYARCPPGGCYVVGAPPGPSVAQPRGPAGPVGPAGKDGLAGRGIQSLDIDAAGMLVVTYTDGQVQTVGQVRGKDGRDAATPTYTLQPMTITDGQMQPYGQPIPLVPNGSTLIPPTALQVTGSSGRKTYTPLPLGGGGGVKLGGR